MLNTLSFFFRSSRLHLSPWLAGLLCAAALGSLPARAQESAPAPPPPPYSIPWQLRPAGAATVVRSDTAVAFYENPASGESGTTVASMLLGSYKLTPEFAPLVRLGVVSNSPPDGTMVGGAELDSGFNFINPVVGGTYVIKLPADMRLALFLGLTVPIGGGGGDMPDPANAQANARGILARSQMDNAMFAADYFTIFPGVDLAWVKYGFTVQLEVTLLELIRVRGGDNPLNDDTRTNFTSGIHVGYFLIPELVIAGELRHQRWLSTPNIIKEGVAMRTADDEDMLRDTTTFAIGLRGNFKLSETVWIRPGLAYARGLDDPMDAQDYNILQIDVPVQF